jgi:hypothetical protein
MADDSIYLIPSRDQWRALINIVMKLGIKLKAEDFLIAWVQTLPGLGDIYGSGDLGQVGVSANSELSIRCGQPHM